MARESFGRFLGRGLVRWLLFPAVIAGGWALVASDWIWRYLLFDFHGGLYNAGVSILHGRDPYWPAFLAHQAAIMRAGGMALGETATHAFSIPVYPAGANLAVVPLSLLPLWLADGIYMLLSIAAMLGGLRLLGVRDLRCLALACVSYPFLFGLYLGAVGPFLVLGAGAGWRWRERLWPPALAVGSLVALKIFPWTLGAWLLITRRYRAAALSIAVCLAITLGAWAVIGWHGLAQYPAMLSEMSYLQEGRAISVVTVLVVAGVSPGVASVVAIALAVALLGLAWRIGRRPGGERAAFALAIIAALTGTPIVWDHYMVLLFVPIALVRPRYSRLWLVPVVTPVLAQLTIVLVPNSHKLQAHSPNALRNAFAWLIAEAVVAVWATTTPEQRGALVARLRPAAGGRLAPASAPEPASVPTP